MTLSAGVYAEMVGSVGVAVVLFLFFHHHDVEELFRNLGTGTALGQTVAFLAALAIAG